MKKDYQKFLNWQKKSYSWSRMLYCFPMSYLISARISPYFSYFFIKHKVSPNSITLLMIISGILGGGLLSYNSVFSKILSVIIIQIWFVLDCSDGEVARFTKQFSDFGGDLDTIAHVVDHVFIGFGFAVTFMQLYGEKIYFYLIVTTLLLDSIYRVLILMDKLHPGLNTTDRNVQYKISFRNFIGMLVHLFSEYPNVVLLSSLTIFIDIFGNFYFTPIIFILNLLITFVLLIKNIVSKTSYYLKN